MLKTRKCYQQTTYRFFSPQVSVRREVPQTIKDFIQDEPEDWTLVFPKVKQVFFLVKASATSGTIILLFFNHTVFSKCA